MVVDGNEEPIFKSAVLTCNTNGCGNSGIDIPLNIDSRATEFLCGGCNQYQNTIKWVD
jgi:hypothetical protein